MKAIIIIVLLLTGLAYTGEAATNKGYCDCIFQKFDPMGIAEIDIQTFKVYSTGAITDALCQQRCPKLMYRNGRLIGKTKPYVAQISLCQRKKCCTCPTLYYNNRHLPLDVAVGSISIKPWSGASVPTTKNCQQICRGLFGKVVITKADRTTKAF